MKAAVTPPFKGGAFSDAETARKAVFSPKFTRRGVSWGITFFSLLITIFFFGFLVAVDNVVNFK
jgi:hypothetical protein